MNYTTLDNQTLMAVTALAPTTALTRLMVAVSKIIHTLDSEENVHSDEDNSSETDTDQSSDSDESGSTNSDSDGSGSTSDSDESGSTNSDKEESDSAYNELRNKFFKDKLDNLQKKFEKHKEEEVEVYTEYIKFLNLREKLEK